MIPSFGSGAGGKMVGEAAGATISSNETSLAETKDTAKMQEEATKAQGAVQRNTIATNAAQDMFKLMMQTAQKTATTGKEIAEATTR